MTTLKQQVRDAAELAGDNDYPSMVCFFRPAIISEQDGCVEDFGPRARGAFADLPERKFDAGYGGHEGEPFIGFTEQFVYVCGTYDGAEWIVAVPRSPEVVESFPPLPTDKWSPEQAGTPIIGG